MRSASRAANAWARLSRKATTERPAARNRRPHQSAARSAAQPPPTRARGSAAPRSQGLARIGVALRPFRQAPSRGQRALRATGTGERVLGGTADLAVPPTGELAARGLGPVAAPGGEVRVLLR